MRELRLGTGALVGLLATGPLLAVMALARRLAGLPFLPYDLFDWATRVLPGGLVTFGIDTMISLLGGLGLDVADTAKTAERASAVLAFAVLGIVAAALFFAFFGARGISRVQVRVDGGPWQEARLRTPLSETTWVLWRHDWPFEEGEHTFEVRCAEANGTPQIEERRKNRPSGATGLHSAEVEV